MIQYLSDLLNDFLNDKLLQLDLPEVVVESFVRGGLILLVLFACWIVHQIAQGPIIRSFERFSRFTNLQWDDVLVEKHVFQRLLSVAGQGRIFQRVRIPFRQGRQATG